MSTLSLRSNTDSNPEANGLLEERSKSDDSLPKLITLKTPPSVVKDQKSDEQAQHVEQEEQAKQAEQPKQPKQPKQPEQQSIVKSERRNKRQATNDSCDLFRRDLFRWMKIVQIIVSCILIAFYALLLIAFLVVHDNAQMDKLKEHKLLVYIFLGIYTVIAIFGIISAAREWFLLSLIHSIGHTLSFPYCIVCWIVTIGIYRNWSISRSEI